MKKIVIADCFNLGSERIYEGKPLLHETRSEGGFVFLENGVCIENMGDGRYYDSDNEANRYAAVLEWDDEADCGDLLGYVLL